MSFFRVSHVARSRFLVTVLAIASLLTTSTATLASSRLAQHFWGSEPRCVSAAPIPVILVAGLTLTGEIDDSISVFLYRQLERMGCVRVLAVVSIFGNGESSTAEIHANLQERLPKLGESHWPLLRGPDRSYRAVRTARPRLPNGHRAVTNRHDAERLAAIAALINAAGRRVVVVELGPMTVSARLLAEGYVAADRIARVLAIGGRLHGERFGQAKGLLGRFGSFTDFNVRKDTMAADYLVRHVPEKLILYTYRNGVGARMVSAAMVSEAIPALTGHAQARESWLRRMLGYTGIPSWDTWTTSCFIAGRMDGLGCTWTRARLRSKPGVRWPQLWLTPSPRKPVAVLACHPKLVEGGPVVAPP